MILSPSLPGCTIERVIQTNGRLVVIANARFSCARTGSRGRNQDTTARSAPSHLDDDAVRILFDDALDAALWDGEGNMHAFHGGEGRSGDHRPESIRRRPRKVSKSPNRGNPRPACSAASSSRSRVKQIGPLTLVERG